MNIHTVTYASFIMSKNNPFKIAVLASGRGSNFQALASAIAENSWNLEISLLLSDRPKSKALNIASSLSIPSQVVEKSNLSSKQFSESLAKEVASVSPDLVVLAGFMRVLDRSFIASFQHRIVNIHPSILPSFKGLNAQAQALEAGVHFTGCTAHLVNEELDSGAILGQSIVPVLKNDSVLDLEARILKEEHILLPKVIHKLASGQIEISDKGEVDFKNSRIEGSETFSSSLVS